MVADIMLHRSLPFLLSLRIYIQSVVVHCSSHVLDLDHQAILPRELVFLNIKLYDHCVLTRRFLILNRVEVEMVFA